MDKVSGMETSVMVEMISSKLGGGKCEKARQMRSSCRGLGDFPQCDRRRAITIGKARDPF